MELSDLEARIESGLKRSLTWTEKSDGILKEDSGRFLKDIETDSILEYSDGLKILHSFGDPYQRGLGHGRLLKNEIQSTKIVDFYGNFLYDLFSNSDAMQHLPDRIRHKVGHSLEHLFYTPLEKHSLPEVVQELEGVSDGADIDMRKVLRATLSPDVMEQLAGNFLNFSKDSLGNYFLAACSAFYVRNSATKKKDEAIFARNMDFPGSLVWKPLVIINHPTEPMLDLHGNETDRNKPAHAYITASGFPGHGLTGFSKSGIAMSSHVCISKNISRKGLPSLQYNHLLFTRNDSLQGVLDMSADPAMRCTSPHSVLFADKDQSFSLEIDSKHVFPRYMDGGDDIQIQTNHFINPLMRRREMEFPLEREHTVGRYKLIDGAICSSYGKIDVQKAIDIISCNHDVYTGKPAPLGAFPAQFCTLTSVIFELYSGNLWIAKDDPPSVCYNPYQGLNLYSMIEGNHISESRPEMRKSGDSIFPKQNSGKKRRLSDDSLIKKSYDDLVLAQHFMNKGRYDSSISHMEAADATFDCPQYKYVKSLLYLKKGDVGTSLDIMDELSENHKFSPMGELAMDIWKARCYDILDQRDKAKQLYRSVLEDPTAPENFRRTAARGVSKRFKHKDISGTIDFGFMGPLEF
ncbi:MAG: C45 family autoproteolytic acyltransferase/hydrolase [Candidatus Woesearchaeota archaeon]